jgi:hypothetical protein
MTTDVGGWRISGPWAASERSSLWVRGARPFGSTAEAAPGSAFLGGATMADPVASRTVAATAGGAILERSLPGLEDCEGPSGAAATLVAALRLGCAGSDSDSVATGPRAVLAGAALPAAAKAALPVRAPIGRLRGTGAGAACCESGASPATWRKVSPKPAPPEGMLRAGSGRPADVDADKVASRLDMVIPSTRGQYRNCRRQEAAKFAWCRS